MKPSIPKGTRDFLPSEMAKRKYIFKLIEKVFQQHGYVPIETPSMENLSTLTGKYGEEGDKLLFKILNNGDYLAKADPKALEEKNSSALISSISKRGLRYDLTVPFARYVVQHQNELYFPFKRYQMQPVWRADRPQKGRFQEFYQCDVDIVGSDSLMYEAELIGIYDQVFDQLNIPVTIKINNRKILYGIAEEAGVEDQFMIMTIAIDKLDKIGMEGVVNELSKAGFTNNSIKKIQCFLSIKKLDELNDVFEKSTSGKKGNEEIKTLQKYLDQRKITANIEFDVTLARGLNYYTGCILEVKAEGVQIGSIGGGGRYDDLTSGFGLKNMSGVGVSIGVERVYLVMEELDLFPKDITQELDILLIAIDESSHIYAFGLADTLRRAGLHIDLYAEATKMKKQMKYADNRQVPYVIIIGSEEMDTGLLTFKNMTTGDQQKLNVQEIIKLVQH